MATKKEQGGHSPYEPYKPAPSGPYTPAPSRDSIKIASGDADTSSMHYPTEKGFFLDGTGKAYMQNKGKFYEAGEYNPDVHGLPVPLAKRKSLNIAQFPRLSTGEPMTNIEQKQGLEVLRKLQGNQKRKQLKIFMDQYMKGV
tara:strand:- start:38 stop:463 length:426 start_codon:yes stop_codon:yes gene_type:complete